MQSYLKWLSIHHWMVLQTLLAKAGLTASNIYGNCSAATGMCWVATTMTLVTSTEL